MKKRANFKTNKFIQAIQSFFYCLNSREHNLKIGPNFITHDVIMSSTERIASNSKYDHDMNKHNVIKQEIPM